MLWTFVKWQAAQLEGNGLKMIPVFHFDSNQQTALQALSQELHARQFIAEKAIATLYLFLDALYFPLNTTLAFSNVFHSPVVSFLACRFLTTDGAYISIHNIPPVISKLQYAMRLRGLYKLSGIAKKVPLQVRWTRIRPQTCSGTGISHLTLIFLCYSQSW